MKKLLLFLLFSIACFTAQAQLPTLSRNTMVKFTKGDTTFMDSIATLSTLISNIVGTGVTSFSTGGSGLTVNSTTGAVQINGGQLAVTFGGTGLSSAPSAGQLLVGNTTSGYTLSNLSAIIDTATGGALTRTGAGTLASPYALTIKTSGVTTGLIADNAVDGTKINLTGNAQGDIMYYNGTDWVVLPAGDPNTYLEGGSTPAWGAIVLDQLPKAAPNTVVAGPASGSTNGSLSARALVAADLPNLAANYIVNGTAQQATSNFNISGSGTIGGDLILTNILSNTGQPINISASAVADTVNIGTGAALKRIVLGNTTNGTNITLTAGGNAGDAISLTGGAATNYSIGTGATTGTITIGNTTQTGAITVGSSTGTGQTVNIGSGNTTGTDVVNIATGTATTAKNVNIATGAAGTINVGTGAFANVINLGSSTGASGITQLVGTGNFVLNGAATSTYTIGAATTSGTITVGGTGQTGSMTLGQSTATNTINIGSAITGAGNTQTVNIANGAGAGTATNVSILSGVGTAGTGTLSMANNKRVTTIDLGNVAPDAARTTTIAGGNSGVVDLINIASGATTVAGGKTVNIATGTPTGSGSNLVTIGSTGLASTTTINSGTGGLNMTTGAATNATTTLGTTGSQIFASSTANTDRIAIKPQTTGATGSFTGTITTDNISDNRTYTFPNASGTIPVSATAPVAISALGNIALTSSTPDRGEFLVSDGDAYISMPFLVTDTTSISIYQNSNNDAMVLSIPNVTTTRRGVMSTTIDSLAGNKIFTSGLRTSTQSSNPALVTNGAKAGTWTSHTATVNLGLTNDYVQIGQLTAAITVNLPTCESFTNGVEYTIHKTGNDNFAVIIDPASTQQFVDGATVKLMYSKGTTARCKCRFETLVGTWYYESM